MTDAPERIWAWERLFLDGGRVWTSGKPHKRDGVWAGEEYVRADLHAATVARAEKAEALLKEAVDAGEALVAQAAHVHMGGCIPAMNIHEAARNLAEPINKWDAFFARLTGDA